MAVIHICYPLHFLVLLSLPLLSSSSFPSTFSSLCLHLPVLIAPSSAPLNPSHQIISSRSFNISWHPPPVEDQNGDIQYYLIHLIEVDTNVTSPFFPTSTSITLTMLHPYYTYVYSISAFTVGEGPYTSENILTLPEDGNLSLSPSPSPSPFPSLPPSLPPSLFLSLSPSLSLNWSCWMFFLCSTIISSCWSYWKCFWFQNLNSNLESSSSWRSKWNH